MATKVTHGNQVLRYQYVRIRFGTIHKIIRKSGAQFYSLSGLPFVYCNRSETGYLVYSHKTDSCDIVEVLTKREAEKMALEQITNHQCDPSVNVNPGKLIWK